MYWFFLSRRFADEKQHEILVAEFNGQPSNSLTASSYVAITKQFQVGQNLDLEVWFLSRSADGMLIYAAQDAHGRGDFIWLALIGGRAQFRWDLGSGAGIVTYVISKPGVAHHYSHFHRILSLVYSSRSSDRVTLFVWHRILVSRRGKETTIRLDDGAINQGRSLGPLSELNLDTALYVGGLRSSLALPRDVPKLSNLQGAVQRVMVNGEVFDKLMEDDDDSERENVSVYRGPPCGHMPITHQSRAHSRDGVSTPCMHGGICQPLLANFICKCQPGFLGKRCEKR